eukprot:990875-Pyramimonas_sp.AAC.2
MLLRERLGSGLKPIICAEVDSFGSLNYALSIGDGALIGAGSTILGNIRLGKGVKIGAGSVVLTPIPDYETAVGVRPEED